MELLDQESTGRWDPKWAMERISVHPWEAEGLDVIMVAEEIIYENSYQVCDRIIYENRIIVDPYTRNNF